MDRNETISTIKKALKHRSSINWSVTCGRGTASGWITIDAPKNFRTWHFELLPGMPDYPENYAELPREDGREGHAGPYIRAKLSALLGLDDVHIQGVSIPSSCDYYQEYIDRAEGRIPTKLGVQYWD